MIFFFKCANLKKGRKTTTKKMAAQRFSNVVVYHNEEDRANFEYPEDYQPAISDLAIDVIVPHPADNELGWMITELPPPILWKLCSLGEHKVIWGDLSQNLEKEYKNNVSF